MDWNESVDWPTCWLLYVCQTAMYRRWSPTQELKPATAPSHRLLDLEGILVVLPWQSPCNHHHERWPSYYEQILPQCSAEATIPSLTDTCCPPTPRTSTAWADGQDRALLFLQVSGWLVPIWTSDWQRTRFKAWDSASRSQEAVTGTKSSAQNLRPRAKRKATMGCLQKQKSPSPPSPPPLPL